MTRPGTIRTSEARSCNRRGAWRARAGALILTAALLALPAAGRSLAGETNPAQELMEIVPAEAAVVLVVKSGEELRDDLLRFLQNAGIGREALDWDETNPLGLSEQFDGRRSVALFRRATGPERPGQAREARDRRELREEDEWVALLPVGDAGRALDNLNAEAIGGGLHSFSVRRADVPDPLKGPPAARRAAPPGAPPDAAERDAAPDRVRLVGAVARDDLLAVARQPEAVRWFLERRDRPGLYSTWQAHQRQVFGQMDVFFSVNVNAVRPALLQRFGQDDVVQRPPNAAADDQDGLPPPRVSKAARWYAEQVRSAVEQTRAVYGGALVEEQRIRSTVQIAFEPATRLYEEFAVMAREAEPLLGGVPARSFLVACAADLRSLAPLVARLTEQLAELFAAAAPEDERLRRELDRHTRHWKTLRQFECLFDYSREGPVVLSRSEFDDAGAVVQAVRETLRENPEVVQNLLPGLAIDHRQKTIDDHDVLELSLRRADQEPRDPDDADGPPAQPEAPADRRPDATVRIQAAVVEGALVEAVALREDPIELMLDEDAAALRSRETVQTVLEALPADERFAVMLVDPLRLSQVVAEEMTRWFAGGDEQERALERVRQRFEALPPAPPIGMSLSTTGPGFAIHSVVHAETLRPLSTMRVGVGAAP